MKKIGISIGIVALAIGMFSFVNEYKYRTLENRSYERGEKLRKCLSQAEQTYLRSSSLRLPNRILLHPAGTLLCESGWKPF